MDCSTLTIARGRTPRRVREHPPSRPGGPARGADPKTLAASVLAQHGTTYSAEAGITLRDKPAPLFQLLVLSTLCAAPILPNVMVASAGQLFAAGWRTPQRLLASTVQQRVAALDRGGYRQRDQSSARFLEEAASWLQDQYGGDLRRLRRLSRGDVSQMRALLLGFPLIGPAGADLFCREAQAVWPGLRPFFDARAIEGARRVGLPTDVELLASLVSPPQLAAFATALVRLGQR